MLLSSYCEKTEVQGADGTHPAIILANPDLCNSLLTSLPSSTLDPLQFALHGATSYKPGGQVILPCAPGPLHWLFPVSVDCSCSRFPLNHHSDWDHASSLTGSFPWNTRLPVALFHALWLQRCTWLTAVPTSEGNYLVLCFLVSLLCNTKHILCLVLSSYLMTFWENISLFP